MLFCLCLLEVDFFCTFVVGIGICAIAIVNAVVVPPKDGILLGNLCFNQLSLTFQAVNDGQAAGTLDIGSALGLAGFPLVNDTVKDVAVFAGAVEGGVIAEFGVVEGEGKGVDFACFFGGMFGFGWHGFEF